MAEINRAQQRNFEYLKQLAEEQRIQKQERKQTSRTEELKAQNKDEAVFSEKARKLAEAQDFYRKFIEEKAEEIKSQRAEKVKELKEKLSNQKESLDLSQAAQEMAKEFLGL